MSDALRRWWHRTVVADEETSARYARIDREWDGMLTEADHEAIDRAMGIPPSVGVHANCNHPSWCAITGEGDPEAAPVRDL